MKLGDLTRVTVNTPRGAGSWWPRRGQFYLIGERIFRVSWASKDGRRLTLREVIRHD